MKKFVISEENRILLVLMVFCLFYKFFTFRMFDIGGDAINYWFAAKHIFYNLPYIELDHQTARFGLIIPVWFTQFVFGTHPAVSLILPNLFFIIHVILIYRIGVIVKSPIAGFIAAALFMLCPHIIRFGGQVVTEAFAGPLLTACFYFLLRYNDADRREMIYITLSALMLFWAYEVNETNIFFMPGFLLVILLFKRSLKDAFIFSAILFGLFIGETALYYLFTGDIMGRFHAITGHHLNIEKLVPVDFPGLLARYTKSELWWRIPFFIYLIALYPLWKNGTVKIKAVAIPATIFFIIMLFAVKSINPLVPATPYKEVYLLVAVPFMAIILAIGSIELSLFLKNRLGNGALYSLSPVKSVSIAVFVFIISAFVILSSGKISEKAGPYYNNPLKLSEHKIVGFFTFYRIFNNAYNKGTPIVSDYFYTVKDFEIFTRVQKLQAEGRNLDEALSLIGVDKKIYFNIRPFMPAKSLNGVRKIFLDLSPVDVPEVRTVVVNGRIVNYIINEKYKPADEKSLFNDGARVVYATKGELVAREGVFSR